MEYSYIIKKIKEEILIKKKKKSIFSVIMRFESFRILISFNNSGSSSSFSHINVGLGQTT